MRSQALLRFGSLSPLSGPAVSDVYPLGEVARVLSDIDFLNRNAYESLAGVNVEDCELRVRSAFPEKGSDIVDLQLLFQNVAAFAAPLLPLLAQVHHKDVF
jgi:hypothetical protein